MAIEDTTAAEQSWQKGIEALNEGKLDVASEAFTDAEIRFRMAGDYKRAGDSRSLLADTQRQNNMLEKAVGSYQRAIQAIPGGAAPIERGGCRNLR